jgi:hypothetical protein
VDVANSGVGTSQNNDSVGMASNDGGTGEEHVDLILLDGILVLDSLGVFAHTLALASQDRLIDAEAVAVDAEDSAVGGDAVADSDVDNVTRDQLFGLDRLNCSIAHDLGGVCAVLLQGRNSLLGRRFLADTDDGVQDQDGKDDGGIDEGGPSFLFFEKSEDEGDGGAGQEDDNELVLELLEDELPERSGRLFGNGCSAISVRLLLF